MKKKIIFVTGTRADFGKMKSIIISLQLQKHYKVYVFITGMHLLREYGFTWQEIKKSNISNLIKFKNHKFDQEEDLTFSRTITGFSKIIKKIKPNLVVVHGDRIEAFAASVSSILNNTLVGHIEGGEVSGTKDELIRHSISKLSTFHFVSNLKAKKRLLQLGENKKNVFISGSPEMDIINSKNLPTIEECKKKYNIRYNNYAIFIYHPVTNELSKLDKQIRIIINCLIKSKFNYIIIYPNNDPGSNKILKLYQTYKKNKNLKFFPSTRFEYYISLLKNSKFIIGNSSSGVREAPSMGVPSINIGNRQQNRSNSKSIMNVNCNMKSLDKAIKSVLSENKTLSVYKDFGKGNSYKKILSILNQKSFWKTNQLKQFNDLSDKT